MTDRIAAEEALRTSEAHLRDSEKRLDTLIRSSSEVRFSISADWGELYQLAGGDFISDTSTANSNWLNEYIPPEDRDALKAEFEGAIRTRTPSNIGSIGSIGSIVSIGSMGRWVGR